MTHLRSIVLGGLQFTDAGLGHVATLAQLESPKPWHTKGTDWGLMHVGKLSQFQHLKCPAPC